MERGEELMQLNRAAFDRNTQAFERMMAKLDRHEELFEQHEKLFDRHERLFEEGRSDREDLTAFIREMNRRSERVVQNLVHGNQKFLADLSAELREGRDEAREGREEARAQTQALLALIDRLPPPAQAA
jgi:dsDNA-specific endonuclease/ATPase MutS2